MNTTPPVDALLAVKTSMSPASPTVLSAPGGFCWWYAEIIDDNTQSGVVLIWGYGLPFLPEILSDARRGRASCPIDRPSVNIVAYEGGRESFYAFHELIPERAACDDWSFTFGDSKMRLDPTTGVLDVDVDLKTTALTPRLTGTIRVTGKWVTVKDDTRAPSVDTPSGLNDAHPHGWRPLLLPAHGHARLSDGERNIVIDGHAYVDHNEGTTSFDKIGFSHWIWVHGVVDGEARIVYVLTPENPEQSVACRAFVVDETGQMVERHGAVALLTAARGTFGMRGISSLSVQVDERDFLIVTAVTVVDDGPFYQRAFVTLDNGNLGMAEVIAPHRIDRPLTRPLVKMRVTREGTTNSPFHPLFVGPARGRLARFLRRRPTH